MLRPSYAELMDIMNKNSEKNVTSRYTVVIAAAKRARQIIDDDEPMVSEGVDINKPVSIAVEEIREGKISVVPEGQGTKLKPKKTDEEEEIRRELEHKPVVIKENDAEEDSEEEGLEAEEDFEADYDLEGAEDDDNFGEEDYMPEEESSEEE